MDINVNDYIQILSFKQNGYIHRIWDKAKVIEISEERIVVSTFKSRVQESTCRVWYTKEPAILFFYFKKWFNTIAMIRTDGIHYYTNLSSPCVIDNGKIKYIDYDIDIKINSNKEYRILDENEFYCHRYSMNYLPEIETIINSTVKELLCSLKDGDTPYCDEEINLYYNKSLSMR